MACVQGAFTVGPVALTGGTAQTIIQIVAPTNQRLKITGIDLSFDGTNSANTPAEVRYERQTGGTFVNTTVAPKKINDPTGTNETLQAVAKTAVTVEPAEADVLKLLSIPVFGGLYSLPFPPGQELQIPGGTIFALKINAPQSVNVRATITYEE